MTAGNINDFPSHLVARHLNKAGDMRILLLCTTLLAACSALDPKSNSNSNPDGGPVFCPTPSPVSNLPYTAGESGVLQFAWDSFVGQTLDRPLATGAHARFTVAPNSLQARTFTSDNPSVASLGNDGFLDPTIVGHRAGSARITAYDADGKALDGVTIHVADIDGIAFAGDWLGDPGPTVVVGTTERMRIRLLHGTTELVGWGATTFTFDAPLATSEQSLAPLESLPSTEEVFFVAKASGSGAITATAGSATTHLPVAAIAVGGIDQVQLTVTPGTGCRRQVTATLSANGKRVFGPRCTWRVPAGATVQDGQLDVWFDTGGWPGDHPDQLDTFTAMQAGVFDLRCEILGGPSAPLSITVGP